MTTGKRIIRSLALTLFAGASLRAGAAGYLLKNESFEAIVRNIHDVVEGGMPLSSAVTPFVLDSRQPKSFGWSAHLQHLVVRTTTPIVCGIAGAMFQWMQVGKGILGSVVSIAIEGT